MITRYKLQRRMRRSCPLLRGSRIRISGKSIQRNGWCSCFIRIHLLENVSQKLNIGSLLKEKTAVLYGGLVCYRSQDFLKAKIGTRIINTITMLTIVIQSVEPTSETAFAAGVFVTCKTTALRFSPWMTGRLAAALDSASSKPILIRAMGRKIFDDLFIFI